MHIAHSTIQTQPERKERLETAQSKRVKDWVAKQYQKQTEEFKIKNAGRLAEILKHEPDFTLDD